MKREWGSSSSKGGVSVTTKSQSSGPRGERRPRIPLLKMGADSRAPIVPHGPLAVGGAPQRRRCSP